MRIVALPAKIPLSMRGEIDLRRIHPFRFLSMALAAEFPGLGLGRSHTLRTLLVSLRNGMTGRTLDKRVRRYRLNPGQARMAGRAFARDPRRFRIMRIMTGDARLERVVEDRIDLRKSRGPRGVVGVTGGAELSLPRGKWLDVRVLRVFERRAMTGLAGERFMKSGALLLAHVIMAIAADARAGELDRFAGLSLDGGLPVKPAFDQGRRDDVISQRDNRDNEDDRDDREPS